MAKEIVDRLGFDRLPTEVTDHSLGDLVSLQGQVAFVTGGGGMGLGRAIVDRLASQGATVAVVDRDEEAAKRVAAEAGSKWNTPTLAITCDVTEWDSVVTAMKTCVDSLGSLDILVNNVGGGGPVGYLRDNSIDAIDAGIRINLVSQIYCTKAAIEHMAPKGKGVIVNVSSEGGKAGMPGIVVYNACKAGVIGFTRNIVHEVSKNGIRVNCVCPGIMLIPEIEAPLSAAPDDDPMLAPFDTALGRVTVGRGCLPEEVANVVGFLASDAASYVQGASYSVGGGLAT